MSGRKQKRLKVKLTRCWYVTVEDENEFEIDNDWCFGTREDAMRDGQKMLKAIQDQEVAE